MLRPLEIKDFSYLWQTALGNEMPPAQYVLSLKEKAEERDTGFRSEAQAEEKPWKIAWQRLSELQWCHRESGALEMHHCHHYA